MNENMQPMSMREKLWTERNHEEKLDVLREELLEVGRILRSSLAEIALLKSHYHDPAGRLMGPLFNENHSLQRSVGQAIPRSLRIKE